jgi:hypothetical protein
MMAHYFISIFLKLNSMKKTVSLIFMIIIFWGCNQKDDLFNKSSPENFWAKVDGVPFKVEAFYRKTMDPATIYDITSFDVVINGKSTSISLSFWGDTLGTYFFDDQNTCQAFYHEDATASTGTFMALSGSITVTKIDRKNNKLSGRFNFKANDFGIGQWRTIAEGGFNDLPVIE